jgi:RimJ/RimL family protein N-acetyltransferase
MNNHKEIVDRILPALKYGCYFRLVETEDAEFILSIRNDEQLSRYIRKTSPTVADQVAWISTYKEREKDGTDFYLLCLAEDRTTKLGVVRIYDIHDGQFEFGSWVFRKDIPKHLPILADMFISSLAFEQLGLKVCRVTSMEENQSVMNYIKSFNPQFVKKEGDLYHYDIDYPRFKARRDLILKLFSR